MDIQKSAESSSQNVTAPTPSLDTLERDWTLLRPAVRRSLEMQHAGAYKTYRENALNSGHSGEANSPERPPPFNLNFRSPHHITSATQIQKTINRLVGRYGVSNLDGSFSPERDAAKTPQ